MRRRLRHRLATSAASIAVLLWSGPVLAQSGPVEVPNQTPNSAMIALILNLVKQGSISPQNGTILIQQTLGSSTEAETLATAQQAVKAAQAAPARQNAPVREKTLLAPVTTTVTAEQLAAARAVAESVNLAAGPSAASMAAMAPPPPPPAAFAPARSLRQRRSRSQLRQSLMPHLRRRRGPFTRSPLRRRLRQRANWKPRQRRRRSPMSRLLSPRLLQQRSIGSRRPRQRPRSRLRPQ